MNEKEIEIINLARKIAANYGNETIRSKGSRLIDEMKNQNKKGNR